MNMQSENTPVEFEDDPEELVLIVLIVIVASFLFPFLFLISTTQNCDGLLLIIFFIGFLLFPLQVLGQIHYGFSCIQKSICV